MCIDNKKYESPLQLILFGSPGTGKSHKVKKDIAGKLEAKEIFNTVFHPEYTYGDFMGKLMPHTEDDGQIKVSYRYYHGHFMLALASAYKQWIKPGKKENVLLVIDEINRGNSAAIFGTAFQLLDRDPDGWSSYEVNLSEMEYAELLTRIGFKKTVTINGERTVTWKLNNDPLDQICTDKLACLKDKKIRLPPNFSIVGTMNTSDESIYYMDSAFKRRWSWEYVPVKSDDVGDDLKNVSIKDNPAILWINFVDNLNSFITSHSASIRKVEDKQIGYYFIRATKEGEILKSDIQNKLMFFLWDTVFARSKKPLEDLLSDKNPLVTFGDFSNSSPIFIEKIKGFPPESQSAD